MFEQTFKNFGINFNTLQGRDTFSSGDLVTGHISFELTKDTKINSIMMEVTGKANVHWSTGGGGRRKKRRSRRHFSAKLEFFTLRSIIMQNNNAVGGPTKLPPGSHLFPFTCQLPHGDFPSPFQGPCGTISYDLTVSINRPWHMSKDFGAKLKFVNQIDTSQPELRAPLSGSNQTTLCFLWCASPPITMAVNTEKKAFVPGETVKVFCNFSNGSSRTATPKLNLLQKQEYYTHNRANKRLINKTMASVIGHPVNPGSTDVYTEMLLTIPTDMPVTISNCSILVLSYVIEATLSMFAAHDLTVLFPIVLCDTPVQTQVQGYY